MKIERVTNITEWINAINPGEVKSAYLPCDKVQSLNCLASRHNQGRGKQRGKFVHYHYCSDLEVATIICETREDYLISNVQKITSAIFLLQFMFRSIAKNLTKEPCKDVVFILMCSMYFIT